VTLNSITAAGNLSRANVSEDITCDATVTAKGSNELAMFSSLTPLV